MTTFKKGDIVVLVEDTMMACRYGSTARVINGLNDDEMIEIEWLETLDRKEVKTPHSRQMNGWYDANRFKLCPESIVDEESPKLYTAEQMIEFATMFTVYSTDELEAYNDICKQRENEEYELYLKLSAKYNK
jgi:hypothetical protein